MMVGPLESQEEEVVQCHRPLRHLTPRGPTGRQRHQACRVEVWHSEHQTRHDGFVCRVRRRVQEEIRFLEPEDAGHFPHHGFEEAPIRLSEFGVDGSVDDEVDPILHPIQPVDGDVDPDVDAGVEEGGQIVGADGEDTRQEEQQEGQDEGRGFDHTSTPLHHNFLRPATRNRGRVLIYGCWFFTWYIGASGWQVLHHHEG